MTLEHVKKPQVNVGLEPVKPQQSMETGTPKRARVSATPIQLQRARTKLEQQKTELQHQSDSLQPILETRAAVQEQTRIQRLQDQIATRELHAKIQRRQEIQTKQTFFSSFVKSAVQRKSLEATKNSSIQASDARDQYQTAIVPEIMQRLVDDRMTLQSQVTRINQIPNALSTKTEWFNSELPLLRARHNNPASPFRDSPNVHQPTDHQALSLGRVYSLQRLSSGLTPKDAASAILNIQRKADRDTALLGLLSGINPRQSDHASIQRLVSQAEYDFELQRHALLEDAGLQSQALQLATSQANPREANSGISEKIKQKLGGGFPLPENIRKQLEAGLNFDFSSIMIHTDNDADKLAKSVNALAFTTGKDIFFQFGMYNPNTKSGYELIAHEATHVVQQASGQVKPGIDADSSLETQAQDKGAKLATNFDPNTTSAPDLAKATPPATAGIALQRTPASSLETQRDPQKTTTQAFNIASNIKKADESKYHWTLTGLSGKETAGELLNLAVQKAFGLDHSWAERFMNLYAIQWEDAKPNPSNLPGQGYVMEFTVPIKFWQSLMGSGITPNDSKSMQKGTSRVKKAIENKELGHLENAAGKIPDDTKSTTLNLRGAAFNEKDPVNLRSTMDTSSKSNITEKISFGTTFLINEQLATWYKIRLDSGATGFVAAENISVAPDAQATFYQIKNNDNAIDIVAKYYNAKIGLDLRFYVGVLAKLNPKSIQMPSDQVSWGDESSVTAWKKANPLKGFYIWIPSQAYAETLRGTVNNGRLQDHPLEAAAEIGKGIVQKTIKDLGGEEVLKQLQQMGANVQMVWDDPGKFMTNLSTAFGQGFGNFQTNFVTHLKGGVMDWLQNALGANFDIPKTADTAGLLSVGLQVVGLDYKNSLRPMLVSSLTANGVAQLESNGGVLQDVVKTGSLTPVLGLVQSKGQSLAALADNLPTIIMDGLKTFALKAIVTAGIKKLLSMIVPGGGLVQAAIGIYNAITFLIDRAKQIGNFISNLTSSFAAIAKGDIGTAVKKVEAVLAGGLSLSLGFLASVAGLTRVAGGIKSALDKIQAPIKKVLQKIADWFKRMFSSLVKKVTGAKSSTKPGTQPANNNSQQTTGKINGTFGKESFFAGKENHSVWLEMQSSQAKVMIASTPKPAKEQLDNWRAEAIQKGLQNQVNPYIDQAMGIVTRAVKNLNKSASTTTITTVQIEQMWKSDAKALTRVLTVIRNALGPEVNYPFVTDSSGVKRTKLVTISFLCPANLSQAGLRGEFTKQVEGQQEGLNKLSVPEWFTNRSSFLSAGRSNSEQREYRAANKTPWLNTKATEIQTRPYNQELIVQLQKVLTATELNDLQDVTKTPRIPAARARAIAALIWTQQAALHDPDQNAGGNATGISGVGDRDVNSSIGSQWKDRVYLIDREVAKIPEILRPDLKLNTRLRSQ